MERRGGHAVELLLVLVVVVLVAGHLLGQPILLGYVETGSMEPTLEAGDGFVAIPSAVTGDPEPGDVVVFDAQEIEGGGLTTHRIVEETEAGYITQGDANPFTDQDSAEPPVQDAQIVAVAPQPTGDVLTIPYLGLAVMALNDGFDGVQSWFGSIFGFQSADGTTTLAYVLLAISIVAYAIETLRERRERDLESRLGRDSGRQLDARTICAAFAILVAVAALASMTIPAGTHSYDVVSAQSPSDRPLVIEQGTTESIEYATGNSGLIPVLVSLEPGGEGVHTDDELVTIDQRSDFDTSVELTAPDETGAYQRHVTEYRYLYVLPAPLIGGLATINPWLPVIVITGLLGGVTYAIGRLLIGEDARLQRRRFGGRQPTSRREDYR